MSLIFDGCRLEGGEPVGRVLQIKFFRQNAHALDLRHLGYALQRALDQIGKVIKLSIRIPVTGNFCETFLCGLRVANDDRTPRVGMEVVFL